MITAMEESLMTIEPILNGNTDIQRKETELWATDRGSGMNQLPIQQFSYKRQNDIDNYNDISTTIQWWKDGTVIDINRQLEQNEETITANYAPMGHSMNTKSLSTLQGVEKETKRVLKHKQSKGTKISKDGKEPTKRTKNPELWQVNIKKNARLRGEEYVGVSGKIVPAKVMGPPCKCRMRCSEKIEENLRKELHNVFWETRTWEQRKQYIAFLVKESPKQRTRCRGNVKSTHSRQVTFTYSLLIKAEFLTVCKSMFLSTFALSERFVRHAMDKKRTSPGGIIGPDQRGKHTPKTKKTESVKNRVREHINSFATEKSTDPKDRNVKRYLSSNLTIAAMHKLYVIKCKEFGIPDSEIVKESYYREMFKTEFNLGFKRTKAKDEAYGAIE